MKLRLVFKESLNSILNFIIITLNHLKTKQILRTEFLTVYLNKDNDLFSRDDILYLNF